MLIQSLIGGLLSVLTPAVVFILGFLIIAFNNFRMTSKRYSITVIGFGLIVISLYILLGLLLTNYSVDIFSITNSMIGLKILLTTFNVVFGLWIIGLIKIKTKNIIVERLFNLMILLLIGIVFSFSTLSSTGPIIGAILGASMTGDGLLSVILPLFGFSLGMVFVVGLILILTSRLINRLSEKKWWKIVQISFGSLYTLLAIVGLISFLNVA